MLTLIAIALLAGRREIAEIARFANSSTPVQRRRLALPIKMGTKRFYKVPGYCVFYQGLTRMDPEAFAQFLSQWLAQRAGTLPQALAMDSKMIGDHIGLMTLADHENGSPQSMAIYVQKEGHRALRTFRRLGIAAEHARPEQQNHHGRSASLPAQARPPHR